MCTIMIVSDTASPELLPTCQASCWLRVSPAVLPEANTRRFSALVYFALAYVGGRLPRLVTSTRWMLSHTSRYFTYAPSAASTSAETSTTDNQPMMVMRGDGRGRTPWRRRQLRGPPRGAREPATLLSSEPLITPPGRGSDRSVRASDGQAASAAWGPAEYRLGIAHILPSWPRLTRWPSYPVRPRARPPP